MKINTVISKISVVCAAGLMMSGTAMAASSVRSLGGAGTYVGTSTAAAAKKDSTVAATGSTSTRGGSVSLQTNSTNRATAGGTRTSTTRASSSAPRLSIGKYLGSSNAVSGGSSTGSAGFGESSLSGAVSGDMSGLKGRVEALEGFVEYSDNGDTLAERVTDLENAKEDLVANIISALKDTDKELWAALDGVVEDKGLVTETSLNEALVGVATKAELDTLRTEIGATYPTTAGNYYLSVDGAGKTSWHELEIVDVKDEN